MAPILDLPNEDYERATKILELSGIKYSVPKSSGFIYVPSISLYVAGEKSLFLEGLSKAQIQLHSNNQKMLTIPEFKEFLRYAKEHYRDIYNDITEIRSGSPREEFLDASFYKKRNKFFVNYHIFDKEGKIVKKSKILDKNTLMKNKTSGVSLDNWLEDSTRQGLPKKVIKSGNLSYNAPRDSDGWRDFNSVAKFSADYIRNYLNCGINPYITDNDSIWIRVAESGKKRVWLI